jgi:AcrR family transcriptional regulator
MERRSGTEEKIVQTALEMFNNTGIEYVGMRELATALGMRIGNLTYYFPTKDELVNRLALDLAAANNQTIVPSEELTIKDFFKMLERVFRNHIKYRCLMLSFVHLMERNPIIAKRYNKVQARRNETWTVNVTALKNGKYLLTKSDTDVDFLVSAIALIARFWISEAAISYKALSEAQQLQHYLNLIARIFMPYATAKGKRELAEARVDFMRL